MSFRSVVRVVLVAVIVAGCSPSETPPVSNASAVDAAAGTQVDIDDLSCAIARTPVSVFFRSLVAYMTGIGPVL